MLHIAFKNEENSKNVDFLEASGSQNASYSFQNWLTSVAFSEIVFESYMKHSGTENSKFVALIEILFVDFESYMKHSGTEISNFVAFDWNFVVFESYTKHSGTELSKNVRKAVFLEIANFLVHLECYL